MSPPVLPKTAPHPRRADPTPSADEQVSRGQSRDGHVTFGGEERRGEVRRGEASFDEGDSLNVSNDVEDFTSWPVAQIPSDDPGPRSSVTGESWPDPLVRDAAEPARSYCRIVGLLTSSSHGAPVPDPAAFHFRAGPIRGVGSRHPRAPGGQA